MTAFADQLVTADRRQAGRTRRVLRQFFVPIILLVFWQVARWSDILPDYLVSPAEIATTGAAMVLDGELTRNLSISLFRCYSGFLLGSALGVVLGVLVGRWSLLRATIDPLVSITYPAPKIAIFPILTVWLGLGDTSKIALIAISVFYPAYIHAFQGSALVPGIMVSAARTMGASRLAIAWRVILPAATPSILAGLRVSLGLSFIMLFAAELAASDRGLGRLIADAQMYQRFDIMFVAVFSIAAFGFGSDRMLSAVKRRYFSRHGVL